MKFSKGNRGWNTEQIGWLIDWQGQQDMGYRTQYTLCLKVLTGQTITPLASAQLQSDFRVWIEENQEINLVVDKWGPESWSGHICKHPSTLFSQSYKFFPLYTTSHHCLSFTWPCNQPHLIRGVYNWSLIPTASWWSGDISCQALIPNPSIIWLQNTQQIHHSQLKTQ